MSDFAKENLNECDYEALNAEWEKQLCQLGWERTWGENGPGWRAPSTDIESPDSDRVEQFGGFGGSPVMSCYDAWRTATGSPDDLRLGVEKEPPVEPYRKPA